MNHLTSEEIITQFKNAIEQNTKNVDVYEIGRVVSVQDGICKVTGIGNVSYGEVVLFENKDKGLVVELGETIVQIAILNSNNTISSGMIVYRTNELLKIKVGEELIGRVVNTLGEPIDNLGTIHTSKERLVMSEAPPIIARKKVTKPLYTGVKAIDSLIPIGYGQRELILGDRRTGKTTIAVGTIVNQKAKFDNNTPVYCVYVCIGKKASEVAQIAAYLEKQGAMEYTTIVLASAEEAAILQYLAPYVGTSIAEHYRDNGKDALIVYDDLSNHAIAYRTISLLLKRFPGREAYPGDIFFVHSSLLERAACMSDEYGGGSLTALPIIETLGGDISAYIPTNVISITDGQIFLDSKMFLLGQKPAIDTGISVSRVGGSAQTKAMRKVAGMLKLELAQYYELKDFAKVTEVDDTTKAILRRGETVTHILRQAGASLFSFEDQILIIYACNLGCFDGFDLSNLSELEAIFITEFKNSHIDLVNELIEKQAVSEQFEITIKKFILEFKEKHK
ncbi:MAG: F0F1 ATP synthase subunit alpha [Alphaproteobacteria bacterium]|nr:MAG: F0F1 ATP synthase subunit alpha [Alphaproteobacteria bacterium]